MDVLSLKDFLEPTVTIVVGLFAFIVYKMQKNGERQNAAIVIVMDIRHAEQVVLGILERGIDIWSGDTLRDNNWSKYKQLFAQHLSADDFAAFNRFFEACAEMSDARKRMREIFYAALDEKARISQRKLLEEDLPTDFKQEDFIAKVNANDSFIFTPDEPRNRIMRSLQVMGRLSNTAGFEKLKKLAGDNH